MLWCCVMTHNRIVCAALCLLKAWQMFYALRSLRKEGESGLWIGPLETLFPLGAPSFFCPLSDDAPVIAGG